MANAEQVGRAKQSELKVSQLLESWLESIRPGMRASSYTIYQSTVKKHLAPLMGEVPISELSEEKGQQMVGRLKESGLSERSAGDTVRRFQQALKWGSEQGLCPGMGFRLSVPCVRTVKLRFLTKEEESALERYLTGCGEESHLAVLLALRAGLLVGELCALRWDDIDLKNRTLRVNKTLQRVTADGSTHVELLPVEKRGVPIPGELAEGLKALPGERLGWLLPGVKAKLTEPRTMQQRLKRYLKECGLDEAISFSTLRDSFIRNCMESGMDFIRVSRISGCTDLNELWRRYGGFYHEDSK